MISTIAYYYYYHRDMGTKMSESTKNVIFYGSVRYTNRSQITIKLWTHESGCNHTFQRKSIVSTWRTVYIIVLRIYNIKPKRIKQCIICFRNDNKNTNDLLDILSASFLCFVTNEEMWTGGYKRGNSKYSSMWNVYDKTLNACINY